jgi:hypothetical protein
MRAWMALALVGLSSQAVAQSPPHTQYTWYCEFNSVVRCNAAGACSSTPRTATVSIDQAGGEYTICRREASCTSIPASFSVYGSYLVIQIRGDPSFATLSPDLVLTEMVAQNDVATVAHARCQDGPPVVRMQAIPSHP